MQKLKKVLIVDWLDAFGGAERVLVHFEKVFKFNKTYTLINLMHPDNLEKIYNTKTPIIEETGIKIFKKIFRYFFFLFHLFISKAKIDQDVDVIISSSHSIAKGINKTNNNQLHISYFQARNFNYIWEDVDLFFGKFKVLFYPLIFILRKIDINQSKRPDYIISNSIFVKKWIKKRYNRDSTVIYPPLDLSPFNLVEQKDDFYVAVGRIVTVKRFDIIIDAFNQSNKKIVIIGDGDNLQKIKKRASSNIFFTGFLETHQVKDYVSKAKAFIQVGVEGFGIAPIEAQACGTPVIAFGKGGVLETVIDGKTGLFFKEQNVQSLLDAIARFEIMQFDPKVIHENALQFSKERFEKEIKEFVETKYLLFRGKSI